MLKLKNILFLLNVGFILSTESLVYLMCNDYSSYIDRLSNRLASINILYVKIFQAFALNNHLITEDKNNALLRFTDNAPWTYSDIHYADLMCICDKYDLKLNSGDVRPINSGMISLVFKVYNRTTNAPFVIKMKRKHIQEKLDDAIDNLMCLVYILSYIPIINNYQLANVVTKNIETIRQQTNFLNEIDNMEQIRENCKHLKYVKIPKAIKEVTQSYPNAIVMEYINGIKIDEIHKDDYAGFAKQIVKFGLVTSIVHGVTHGDLHSGNVLFIKDEQDSKCPYKIGVIDFGIIYAIDSQYKELMFDVFTKVFETHPRESAIKILNSGIIEPLDILQQIPKHDYDTIVGFTEDIISETIHESKQANQMQLYKFLFQLKECLSKKELMSLGIRPSNEFVKCQLVLAMSHGVTMTLCNGDFITLMDTCLNELFHTQMLR